MTKQLSELWLDQFPRLKQMLPEHRELARNAVLYPVLKPGDVAYHQGWDCPNYVMCLEGKTRVFKTSESGREILIYRVGSGGTCVLTTQCLMAGGTFPAESVAETEATLAALPAEVFRQLMAQSEVFREFVLDDYMRLLHSMIALVDEIAFSTLDQRLAGRLLAEAGGRGAIEKTHQQLAYDLGTVREVISRYLSEWERAGWIRTARGRIEIADPSALAAYRAAGAGAA
jgi:CRP/FNR family transcriptional regulator, anaerobic regulatory protein